jgi:hypothetical protein
MGVNKCPGAGDVGTLNMLIRTCMLVAVPPCVEDDAAGELDTDVNGSEAVAVVDGGG